MSTKSREPFNKPIGAILAGGASRRMGTAKAQLELGGKTLLTHVRDRLSPQTCACVLIGGDPSWAETEGLDFMDDVVPGRAGPAAGLLTALTFARGSPEPHSWVLLTATDMPLLPIDLVMTLSAARQGERPVLPLTSGRRQPLAALWPVSLIDGLAPGVESGEIRSFRELYAIIEPIEVPFPAEPYDPFFNVNTPEDLQEAGRLLG